MLSLEARDVPLTAPPQEAIDGTEPQQCRICLQSGGDDFIAPCLCKGTTKWVHRSCLDHWRAYGQGHDTFRKCPQCHFEYRMQLVRSADESERDRRQRRRWLLTKAAGNFVLGVLLLQLVLITLAVLIRLADPREYLVDLMPFFCPRRPNEDSRTLFEAFRYHKTTYYVAAVVFCLATTGLGAIVYSLVACCMRCRGRNRAAEDCCDLCCGPWWWRTTYPYSGHRVYRCNLCLECCDACCQEDCCRNCNVGLHRHVGRFDMGSNNNNNNNNAVAVVLVLLLVFLVLIGLFVVLCALVVWIQDVIQRYLELKELQLLTGEYIVQDLAELEKTLKRQDPELGSSGFDNCEPSAPDWIPMQDQQVQRTLYQDLQAVRAYRNN